MTADSLKKSLQWHKQTVAEVLSRTPFWLYLLPLLFMLILVGLDKTALSPYLTKESAEIAAPTILGVAFVLALWTMKQQAHIFFKWQSFFALILFFRELHFYGTNNGFYIGFLLMMWWASRHREKLVPYFQHKTIVSLIVLLVWTYLISKSFDRHYWDSLIPAGISSDLFEENLEIIGHLLFFYLVLYTSALAKKS